VLGGEKFGSRLIMGTGGVPSLDVLGRALSTSGTEITTVAMRRIDPAAPGSVLDVRAERTRARDPELMAAAMRSAVIAGRLAHCAGRIPRRFYAVASSRPVAGQRANP